MFDENESNHEKGAHRRLSLKNISPLKKFKSLRVASIFKSLRVVSI